MYRHFLRTLFISLFAVSASLRADHVALSNGDIIHGEIISLEAGNLQILTCSMGNVIVCWNKVIEVTTDEPVYISLLDDSNGLGRLEFISETGGGRLVSIDPDEKDFTFSYCDVVELGRSSLEEQECGEPTLITWERKFGISSNFHSGNTNDSSFDADLSFCRKVAVDGHDYSKFTGKIEFKYKEKKNLATALSSVSVRKFKGKVAYEHFVTDRFSWRIHEELTHDFGELLELRSETGYSLDYYMAKGSNYSWQWYAGPEVVNNWYSVKSPLEDVLEVGFRVGEEFVWKPSKRFSITQSLDYIGPVDLDAAHYWESVLEVKIPFDKRWELSIVHEADYNSQPRPGKKHWDKEWVLKIKYCF